MKGAGIAHQALTTKSGDKVQERNFSNPERQCLRELAEGMDANVQPSGDRVPRQLPGVATVL